MKWTNETPVEEGYHWVKKSVKVDVDWTEQVLAIARIFKNWKCSSTPDSIYCDGELYTINESRFVAFAGPIPQVEE